MARRPRVHYPGGLYHVITKAIEGISFLDGIKITGST